MMQQIKKWIEELGKEFGIPDFAVTETDTILCFDSSLGNGQVVLVSVMESGNGYVDLCCVDAIHKPFSFDKVAWMRSVNLFQLVSECAVYEGMHVGATYLRCKPLSYDEFKKDLATLLVRTTAALRDFHGVGDATMSETSPD